MKFNDIEEERRYLLKRAKAKFRSIRNSGYNTQEEYEENIKTARWVAAKSYVSDMRKMPMCGPSKRLIRLHNELAIRYAQRVNL